MASCSPRALSIGLLLLLWYSSSVVTSLTTKSILSRFPFPIVQVESKSFLLEKIWDHQTIPILTKYITYFLLLDYGKV